MKKCKILASGKYSPQQCKIIITSRAQKFNKQVCESIETNWVKMKKDAVRSGKVLFNGPVFRLEKIEADAFKLVCFVSHTNFKEILGTNFRNPRFGRQFGRSQLANGLACCSLLETADNKFVFAKRSDKILIGEGKWHCVAGQFSPDIFDPNSDISPFRTIYAEFAEEINLQEEQITTCICLGLIEDPVWLKPEFIFYTRTSLSADELGRIIDNAEDSYEHTKISYIPKAELKKFFAHNQTTRISQANYQIYEKLF